MEEFPLSETDLAPLLFHIVRTVRSGAETETRLLGNASREGDFTVSHFSEPFDASRGCVMGRADSGEKTP